MREEVKDFSNHMEKILSENDYKDGWNECNLFYLINALEKEIKELKEALIGGEGYQIMHESVDIANFCMMIWDKQRIRL